MKLVPARLHKGGRRPGPTTLELSTKLEKDFSTHPESKWSPTNPEVDLDDTQKRLLLSRVVKTAVNVIFANHIYQFAGVLFIQLVGGPIGLRLTSIVARIVMDRWSMTFQVKLDKAGWKIWSRMKYVDDINMVLRMRDQCLEWVDGVLVKMPEPVIANESREAHTMRLVKELAESVYSWLKFTSDLPEDHKSSKVPMLDLQVWVQHHPAPAAGNGAPAVASSQQGQQVEAAPLPAVAGDPAAVTSRAQVEENPAGSGTPAGVFSQQGHQVEAASLPAVAGDPAVVTSRIQMGENPAGSGAPAGVFSQQGHQVEAASLPAVVGDPAAVTSQGQVEDNPAGSGAPAGMFSQQGLRVDDASLPAVAGDPAAVTSHKVLLSQQPDTVAWAFYEKPTASSRVLRATSAYTWRAKIVTMTMEVFRRLRNTTRQVTISTRVTILCQFIRKLSDSGYTRSTISGILKSGTAFYYRKLRADLEGGPPLNRRDESNDIPSKRAKMGASERWFKRRRGGARESARKEQGWRGPTNSQDQTQDNIRGHRVRRRRCGPAPQPTTTTAPTGTTSSSTQQQEKDPESTLMVPYTPGSSLQKLIQSAEDTFSKTVGCRKVRVIERGGAKLVDLLGRNDPWASQSRCDDEQCQPCASRMWLKEQMKEARKEKTQLPAILETGTSAQCRREGMNYTLQCMTCLHLDIKTTYRGEGARSARERQGEHARDLAMGNVTSPLVVHSIEEHGGECPTILYLIQAIEPSALYRAARESVMIAKQMPGPTNMNRCMEWGAPRVPVMSVTGGDAARSLQSGQHNPNLQWTRETMEKVESGTLKRVALWSRDPDEDPRTQGPPGVVQRSKRRRVTIEGPQMTAAPLPAVAGDPAEVTSQDQVEENPAGSGAPAGVFSHQGQRMEAAPLPAVAGDPAEVTSQGQVEENPAGSGAPAGVFSYQGHKVEVASLPAVVGDPAEVASQDPVEENPAGSGAPAGVFSYQGLQVEDALLPAVAGDPAEVASQGHAKVNPAGSGAPAGVFSHQGLRVDAAALPAVAGDPAVVTSQDNKDIMVAKDQRLVQQQQPRFTDIRYRAKTLGNNSNNIIVATKQQKIKVKAPPVPNQQSVACPQPCPSPPRPPPPNPPTSNQPCSSTPPSCPASIRGRPPGSKTMPGKRKVHLGARQSMSSSLSNWLQGQRTTNPPISSPTNGPVGNPPLTDVVPDARPLPAHHPRPHDHDPGPGEGPQPSDHPPDNPVIVENERIEQEEEGATRQGEGAAATTESESDLYRSKE